MSEKKALHVMGAQLSNTKKLIKCGLLVFQLGGFKTSLVRGS
jgi:hypothetical protein